MQHEIYYFNRVIIDLFIFLKKIKKTLQKGIEKYTDLVYNIIKDKR